MEEKQISKMEKVGGFFSSLFNKVVNLVIFVIIVGLIAVIGWFFYDKKMGEKDMEILKKENEKLERDLRDEKENREVKVKKEEIKNNENVEVVEKNDVKSGESSLDGESDSVVNENKVNDWKTYKNEKYGFQIKYPSNWITSGEPEDMSSFIRFGTPESVAGGFIWSVDIYKKSDNLANQQKEIIISKIGDQFSGKNGKVNTRKEERKNIKVNGKDAIFVRVTTSEIKDWVAESILIEGNNYIYEIGNGAIKDGKFENFYNSFYLGE